MFSIFFFFFEFMDKKLILLMCVVCANRDKMRLAYIVGRTMAMWCKGWSSGAVSSSRRLDIMCHNLWLSGVVLCLNFWLKNFHYKKVSRNLKVNRKRKFVRKFIVFGGILPFSTRSPSLCASKYLIVWAQGRSAKLARHKVVLFKGPRLRQYALQWITRRSGAIYWT